VTPSERWLVRLTYALFAAAGVLCIVGTVGAVLP
jgi:hypothetical protein